MPTYYYANVLSRNTCEICQIFGFLSDIHSQDCYNILYLYYWNKRFKYNAQCSPLVHHTSSSRKYKFCSQCSHLYLKGCYNHVTSTLVPDICLIKPPTCSQKKAVYIYIHQSVGLSIIAANVVCSVFTILADQVKQTTRGHICDMERTFNAKKSIT